VVLCEWEATQAWTGKKNKTQAGRWGGTGLDLCPLFYFFTIGCFHLEMWCSHLFGSFTSFFHIENCYYFIFFLTVIAIVNMLFNVVQLAPAVSPQPGVS
jgi:hypothetical protein